MYTGIATVLRRPNENEVRTNHNGAKFLDVFVALNDPNGYPKNGQTAYEHAVKVTMKLTNGNVDAFFKMQGNQIQITGRLKTNLYWKEVTGTLNPTSNNSK